MTTRPRHVKNVDHSRLTLPFTVNPLVKAGLVPDLLADILVPPASNLQLNDIKEE
ncbi:hypothetical protein DPMN_037889 [Dreissena polymorpha]|uniref:Uncharacterized protein n=1 Tax=Dreissena polymorpha TaxID=45954 RepID=A0A9D4MDC9_DREPO|nr:hypothetical protein DPMN_037889 [Dreissena polymorpha]